MLEKQTMTVEDAVKLALDCHQRGELAKAADIYDEVLQVAPDSADALHYKGLIQHQVGDSEAAIELIERALELVPVYPSALNNLGNVLRECGRLEEAEERYRQVLEMSPEHIDTLVNMGVVYGDLGNIPEAFEYLQKAIELDPERSSAWHNLGNVYNRCLETDKAKSAFEKAVKFAPNSKSYKEIAKILYKSGKKADSIKTLQGVLDVDPDDEVAKHMIAAFGGSDIPDRASDRFISQTFDGFAANFDESLARLEYKAPQLVGDELKRLTADLDHKLGILDIGCGTGLCGPIVKPLASRLVGVDLSAGMLQKAKNREVYDTLHLGELTEFMQKSDATYDAIVCVDTFVYFGKLDDAFVAAESILDAGGYLIFTVERHTSDNSAEDFILQHYGRYSHVDEYLDRALTATGLSVQSMTPVVPRMELGQPVSGTLVVARKPDE